MSVTIKEISKHTGLAVPTVGNILGRSGARYSEETRKKVLQAAQELGYRPNSSARAMRRGRFGCVALVMGRSNPAVRSYLPPGMLDGIEDALAKVDQHLAVARVSDEELLSSEALPKVLRESMADGMLMNYTHGIPKAMLDLLSTQRMAAVWMNVKLAENCVHPDDLGAARLATEGFLARGHRRIAFLHLMSTGIYPGSYKSSRALFHYSVADRADGYREAMKGAGLEPRVVHDDRFIPDEEQLEACRAILKSPHRPTAVLVYSDRDVSALLCAAAEAGLRVPEDLSVMAFFAGELFSCGRKVSTLPVPVREVGRQAVEMLLKRIESPQASQPPVSVPYGSAVGSTVASPPASG